MPKVNVEDIVWTVILFISMAVSIILLLSGCQIPEIGPLLPATPKQALIDTVLKTDWIVTASILGVALSVMAWMNGSKTAIGVMAGCGVAIWMQLTVVRYAHVLAWVGLVFAVGVMLWTVFVKNRALKEIVCGVQYFKDFGRGSTAHSLETCLNTQAKTTQKIVSGIKSRVLGSASPDLEKEKRAVLIKLTKDQDRPMDETDKKNLMRDVRLLLMEKRAEEQAAKIKGELPGKKGEV